MPLFLEYTKPSGRAVCNRPGSLTQRAVELLGDLYGMPFLLATTRNASTPSREYAVAALGKTKIGEA